MPDGGVPDRSRREFRMSQDERKPQAPAKPYQPPKVVDYGSTSKLSAAKPGNVTDGTNPSNRTCL
jgi:hypothetical protein